MTESESAEMIRCIYGSGFTGWMPHGLAKEEGSHSGLGLSMVTWIAQAHGGNVRVESELGKGSCFTFELKF